MTVSCTQRGTCREPAPLFPLLKSSHVKTEAVGELPTAQPETLAQRDNPAGGRIVDDPARQLRLAADMGECFAQRRFDLTSELCAFIRHQPVVPFLIAATRRAGALVAGRNPVMDASLAIARKQDPRACRQAQRLPAAIIICPG